MPHRVDIQDMEITVTLSEFECALIVNELGSMIDETEGTPGFALVCEAARSILGKIPAPV
jgi:hypothetical protein